MPDVRVQNASQLAREPPISVGKLQRRSMSGGRCGREGGIHVVDAEISDIHMAAMTDIESPHC